jgi:hypothetical protein
MNRDGADPVVEIPAFAKPLAPYLKTRHEVLRIRQALTLYLRSHITFAGDGSTQSPDRDSPHLSLCVPADAATSVKRLPPDLTGVRKEYLKALQENIDAREEYNGLCNKVASREIVHEKGSDSIGVGLPSHDPQTYLRDYLSTLRERRRHERLRLFDRSLQELSVYNEKKVDDAQAEHDHKRFGQENLNAFMIDSEPATDPGRNVQELITPLERAVLRAKHDLDRERGLLKDLEAQRQSNNKNDDDHISSAARTVALQRTRDELVQWVEDKLAVSNTDENGEHESFSPSEMEQSSQLLEEHRAEIRERYASYVRARRSLLDALSLISQISCKDTSSEPDTVVKSLVEQDSDGGVDWAALDSFGYASEVLLPGSKVQRSLALQRSFLSGLLAKERASMAHGLDRLSDESHLLPNYPILARHSKFKHITATARSRADQAGPSKEDEIVAKAQAWAFASEAARSNDADVIESRIESGSATVQDASETLQQVCTLLNQDNIAVAENISEDDQDDSDIWAAEVRSTRRGRPLRNEKRSQGPWSYLNGRVGDP